MAFLSSEIILLFFSAVALSILVYLMYRSAISKEWGELSKREKTEMRSISEAKLSPKGVFEKKQPSKGK